MTRLPENADVVIIGGGMAGLTLALQIRQANKALSIVVLERHRYPFPETIHKVGESTVEIGSHYLAHTLGLKRELEHSQLRKFGLRFFFGASTGKDLSQTDELGASSFLPATSYQLDRGRLENQLWQQLDTLDVVLVDRCTVNGTRVCANAEPNEIRFTRDGQKGTLTCHWLVDAASRTSLLKRQLDLGQASEHQVSAAWCRLDRKLDVEDWSVDRSWRQRCNGIPRMLSTNHFLGPGYWAWVIPLVNDRVSIGLVAHPNHHELEAFNGFEKLTDWMKCHQPRIGAFLEASADQLLDFRYLRNFSHDCKRTISTDAWALTGEAGIFADPFYSPGTDFIAISNSLISDLILTGPNDPLSGIRSAVYEKIYKSFFESTMSLYRGQYSGFGDTRLMVLKATWDYAYYWSVLAWLFFRNRLTDIAFLRSAEADLNAMREQNFAMQSHFRERAARCVQSPGKGRFFDQRAIPILLGLNRALLEPSSDDLKELRYNKQQLETLFPLILALLKNDPCPDSEGEHHLLGDLRARFG